MSSREAGSLLIQPLILGSLAVLLLNDHYLKVQHPSPLSGILSDVAGLAFFPVLMVSLAELALRRPLGLTPYLIAAAMCALLFALIESDARFDRLYEDSVGWLQLPLRVIGLVDGHGAEPVRSVSDRLDLLALPFVALGPLLARRRCAANLPTSPD